MSVLWAHRRGTDFIEVGGVSWANADVVLPAAAAVPVLCLDPLDKGRCSASITRYYYNAKSKMCEQFVYSGCGGSSNNFVSRQSCTDVCARGASLCVCVCRGDSHDDFEVCLLTCLKTCTDT